MKTIVIFAILLSSSAFAEESTTATTPPKTEETVTLSEEATAPLFDRIRGAHVRALQSGKVVATTSTMTIAP